MILLPSDKDWQEEQMVSHSLLAIRHPAVFGAGEASRHPRNPGNQRGASDQLPAAEEEEVVFHRFSHRNCVTPRRQTRTAVRGHRCVRPEWR
jgi:hypothetical protein